MFAKLKSIREQNETGFTLIELLVVILIIGILAAIAIPMFLSQRTSAVDASVKSDVRNTATQIETWMTKNPSSPAPTETAVGSDAGTTVTADWTYDANGQAVQNIVDTKIGTGTTVVVKPGAEVGTYTICGYNEGGDQASSTSNAIVYDSVAGGVTSGVACP